MTTRSRLAFLPACVACALASFVLWRWLGAPVTLPEAPTGRLACLSYTPFEPGQSPGAMPGWVSDARIEDDMRRLAGLTGCLRLYTPLGNSPRVVASAERHGLRILLGAWIGSNLEQNEREVAGALDLARRHPGTVKLIVVGNEVLLRRELPAAKLAALIGETRAASPVPVAYADVAHFIAVHPEVAATADALLIHLLPYWDDPAPPGVDKAAAGVIAGFDEFRARFPGRQIAIGETGWPSAGRQRGPGRPGVVEQARFVRQFAALATARGIDYNLIEAIDQPWKRPAEGTVGGYWGLLDEHRVAKFPLQGPVSAWPQWRRLAGATAALAVLLLAAALPGGLAARAWTAWTPVAFTTALVLVFQWRFLALASQSGTGWALGLVGAALTAWAALRLLARLRDGQLREPASLTEVGRMLMRPVALLRSPALHSGACVALVLLGAAWFSVVLAFAPRHRDLPIAFFLLPALAIACTSRVTGGADRREEASLALMIGGCCTAQLEPENPQSWAWLGLGVLLVVPWRHALRREFARIGRLLADPRQAQQRSQHG